MTLSRRIDAALYASPRHHCSILGQTALEDLIPADQPPSLGIDESLNPADKVTLKLRLIPKAFNPYPVLAFAALFPGHLGCLVAPDMDIFRREQFHHLAQHILHKRKNRIIAGT